MYVIRYINRYTKEPNYFGGFLKEGGYRIYTTKNKNVKRFGNLMTASTIAHGIKRMLNLKEIHVVID